MDLSRINFVVHSELLVTLTSLLQFNRFFVVHLWSGLFCSTVSLCCVLDALSLEALSAFAELDFELQYSVTCSTLGSGWLMRFILFGHRVEIALAIFQTTGKRCRIFTIGNTGMHLPICSFFRTRFIRGGHGLGFVFV